MDTIPLVVLVAAIIVLLVLVYLHGTSLFSTREPFQTASLLHLSGPTKCFSCEASFPPEYAWMGRQTKCFDCEKQLAREDPYLANMTHGTKCFSCERPVAIRKVSGCSQAGCQQQYPPPPEQEEDWEPPPQAVHHHTTSARPFYDTDVAQMCMDAGSGQCLF